jgi:hypothetical protein
MSFLDPNLQYLLISLFILFVITLGIGVAAIAPSSWTRTQKTALAYSFYLLTILLWGLVFWVHYHPYMGRATDLHGKLMGS